MASTFLTAPQARSQTSGPTPGRGNGTVGRFLFYAVAVGHTPGIYPTWELARVQVLGVSGAIHKGFNDLAEAETWVEENKEKPHIFGCITRDGRSEVWEGTADEGRVLAEQGFTVLMYTSKEKATAATAAVAATAAAAAAAAARVAVAAGDQNAGDSTAPTTTSSQSTSENASA